MSALAVGAASIPSDKTRPVTASKLVSFDGPAVRMSTETTLLNRSPPPLSRCADIRGLHRVEGRDEPMGVAIGQSDHDARRGLHGIGVVPARRRLIEEDQHPCRVGLYLSWGGADDRRGSVDVLLLRRGAHNLIGEVAVVRQELTGQMRLRGC